MKYGIVGFGNQGIKRKKFIKKKDLIFTYDKFNKKADYNDLNELPLEKIKSIFLCVPDKKKYKLIRYFLNHGKHILVEKPLILKNKQFNELEKICLKKKLNVYTAYNHRFEPHLVKLKNILVQKKLGKIYYMNIFYGNGTAKLVKKSYWKDNYFGVLADLGSHLIDLVSFLFPKNIFEYELIDKFKFENRTNDHAIFISKKGDIKVLCETTLNMWKNTFRLDVIGQKGSAHINGFCKWGPSKLTVRSRILPSGKPKEKNYIIKMKDPTWTRELNFFKKISSKKKCSLKKDKFIAKQILKLTK